MFGVGLDDENPTGTMLPYSKGGQDPNLAARIARHLGDDVPDVHVSSYHPRMGVLN